MSPTPSPEDAGHQALKLVEQVLQKKPEKDDYALTEATQKLCLLRDDLIGRTRGDDAQSRQRLETLNAVLSIVAATHFPVGKVPWDALDGARGALAQLLGEAPA